MKTNLWVSLLVGFFVFEGIAASDVEAYTVYHDYASFSAAAGATTTYDFESDTPGLTYVNDGYTQTNPEGMIKLPSYSGDQNAFRDVGDFTIDATGTSIYSAGIRELESGNNDLYLNTKNDTTPMNVIFDNDITAFGFDYVAEGNQSYDHSTFILLGTEYDLGTPGDSGFLGVVMDAGESFAAGTLFSFGQRSSNWSAMSIDNITYHMPSSITVHKDASRADGSDFAFTSDFSDAFSLDDADPDDADAIEDTIVFSDLEPATYTFTEVLAGGWALAGINCSGGSSISTDVSAATLSITLADNESVDCTFINEPLICGINEYVSSHACVACSAGFVNESGDDATGNDTSCELATFTVGGIIAGLVNGESVVLQNNGGDDLEINTNGRFTFATPITVGSTYNVTVISPPPCPTSTCTIKNGNGTLPISNVTDVRIELRQDMFKNGFEAPEDLLINPGSQGDVDASTSVFGDQGD